MRLIFLFAALAGVPAIAQSIQPRELRCEYRINPQGIDVTEPRLSWLVTATNPNARGLHQTAYRILVASSERGLRARSGDLWDSGRVESGESTHVVYGGKPLGSSLAVFWKVQVWDQAGQASEWSQPAQWSMGLRGPADWQGKWIGREEQGLYEDPASPYHILKRASWIWDSADALHAAAEGNRYFRTSFQVPAGRKVVRAVSIAGAANAAAAFLNGRVVLQRSNPTIPAVADVTAALGPGANVLAVETNHTDATRPGGMIAALRVDFDSGEPLLVQTGSGWRVSATEGDGWQQAGFRDEAWQPAAVIGEYGVDPWGQAGFTGEHRLPSRYLRKEFAVAQRVRRATVYYSGLGLSELYLNGAKVGDHVLSPGLTDYDKHVLYVTFDVTRQLLPGRNAVGLVLGNGRYYAPRLASDTRHFGYPKALLQLNIEYQDGSRSSVVSDETWKLTTAGPIRANNEYDGEEYDAQRELSGWDRAGFDDSTWQAAQALPAPGGALVAEMAEPLRVIETLHPLSVKPLKPGVYVFDMGQNIVGWCRLRVAGPKGTEVRLRHAETLAPDGSLYLDNLRTARATDLYTLKGQGTETWEPRFTYHGFRYVEMTGFPGTPTTAALEGRVVHDDMPLTADFRSSSETLNGIHHNIFWGVRGNYRSIPTDCPQRDERQGWLGDRAQVSRSESYLFNVAAFYTKWERDLEDAQDPEGAVPDVAPTYWPRYNDDVTWPSALMFVPGMLYDQYGDKRALEQAYPAMRRWLEHQRGFLADGIMTKDKYGDWCVPPEDPKLIHSQDPKRVTDGTLIGTAYYYHLLRLMGQYARLLDRANEAADWETLANQVNAAFQARFFKAGEAVYDNGTQTSSVLPLWFQMVPTETRAPVLASLARNIEQVTGGHVGTGLIGVQFLMRTLVENGRSDLAYEVATQRTYPGWGYMLDKGATTIWELWNGDTADPAMNSGNHVMQIGDLGVWMYEYLAGMRSDPERPGFRHILIRPYPAGDLTFAGASHQSPYGKIATFWKREAGRFSLDVTIPPNTTATVWVPSRDARTVTESGRAAAGARGVRFVRTEAEHTVFELESGSYHFVAATP